MRRVPPSVTAAAIIVASFAAVALLGPLTAKADELTLKDGTKITGTIVGFEAKSFRVKTSYGFAEVQRDQVVSIDIAEAAKPASSEAKSKPVATTNPPAPAAKPGPAHESKPATLTASAAKPAVTAAKAPEPVPAAPIHASVKMDAAATAAPARAIPPVPAAPAIAAPSPVAGVAAPQPPEPEPIREEVTGNVYTNDTYRFRMYKPPNWQVIDGARTLMPGAIAAMGTEDSTTYLLVGQEPAAKSLASAMDAAEGRLQDVMENFRPLAEERVMVSGSPAIERHFRGSVDEHDWSGVVVLVPRGAHMYAVFGMTRADNDLVQIEENVIARAISSLQFSE